MVIRPIAYHLNCCPRFVAGLLPTYSEKFHDLRPEKQGVKENLRGLD